MIYFAILHADQGQGHVRIRQNDIHCCVPTPYRQLSCSKMRVTVAVSETWKRGEQARAKYNRCWLRTCNGNCITCLHM